MFVSEILLDLNLGPKTESSKGIGIYDPFDDIEEIYFLSPILFNSTWAIDREKLKYKQLLWCA